MRAFAQAICVAVVDEAALEDGFDDVAEGMVYDPVPTRGHADQTALRFLNVGTVEDALLMRLSGQFGLQLDWVVRQMVLRIDSQRFAALALACFAARQ
jgi:hypothetical protein